MSSSDFIRMLSELRQKSPHMRTLRVVEHTGDSQVAVGRIGTDPQEIADRIMAYANNHRSAYLFDWPLSSPQGGLPATVDFYADWWEPQHSDTPPRLAAPGSTPDDGYNLSERFVDPAHPYEVLQPTFSTAGPLPDTVPWLRVDFYGPQGRYDRTTVLLQPKIGLMVSVLVRQVMHLLCGQDLNVVMDKPGKRKRGERQYGLKSRPVTPDTSKLDPDQARHAWFRYYFLCKEASYPGSRIRFTHEALAPHVAYVPSACRNAYGVWRRSIDPIELAQEFNKRGY